MNAAICAGNQTRPELTVKSNFAIYHLVNVAVDFPALDFPAADSQRKS